MHDNPDWIKKSKNSFLLFKFLHLMQQSNKIANLRLNTERDGILNENKEDLPEFSRNQLNFRFSFRKDSDA